MTTFKKGDIVRHIRTGNIYRIVMTPNDRVRIELDGSPAYAYVIHPFFDDMLWIRPATEMEDGRFSIADVPARAAVEEIVK